MLPNLLLAGAPKCGTTAVYDWLMEHPDVCGGIDKELFYLMDPTDWKFNPKRNWRDHGVKGYSTLFKEKSKKWVVDGTTLTIYQDAAIEYAKHHKPRVVFFLREPASRTYSTFKYLKNNRSRLSDDVTFSKFIEKVRAGEDFDGNTQLECSVAQSKYMDYILNWEAAVGLENIKVYIFEDFMRKPDEGMKDLCEWLGVSPNVYDDFVFGKQNESLNIKWKGLNRLKEWMAHGINNRKLKAVLRPIYYRLNAAPAPKYERDDDKVVLDELKQEFFESNCALANKFNLNLAVWEK